MNATRRRLRWFVALHVGAVAALYGVAHAIGGGWAQVLPPDLQVAAAPAVLAARHAGTPGTLARGPAEHGRVAGMGNSRGAVRALGGPLR